MKAILLTLTFCSLCVLGFSQDTAGQKARSQNITTIKVPDFADPGIKSFYTTYSKHLLKCIAAIREKNEAEAIRLFKDPGEQLVAREKIIAKELVKNAAEKQKYMELASQVYPYIKELEQSAYYKKIYGK
jgi:hypothetical protein